MLTEDTIIDQITVLADGQIMVRRANLIFRDGVEIAKEYHRHVLAPGADTTKEDSRVQMITAVVHTPAVIAAYRSQ